MALSDRVGEAKKKNKDAVVVKSEVLMILLDDDALGMAEGIRRSLVRKQQQSRRARVVLVALSKSRHKTGIRAQAKSIFFFDDELSSHFCWSYHSSSSMP